MSGDLTQRSKTDSRAKPRVTGPLDRVLDGTVGLSGVLLWAMTATVTVSVLSRYFLGRPLAPLFELTEYGLLAVTVLAAAAIARDDGHVRMDLAEQYTSQRVNRILDVLADVVVLVVAGTIAAASAYVTYRSYVSGALTTTFMRLPRWPILIMIPVGMSLVVVEQVRRLLKRLRGRR